MATSGATRDDRERWLRAYAMNRSIPFDLIERASQAFEGSIIGGVTELGDYDQVVRVQSATDTTQVCAEALIQGADGAPPSFYWLDDLSPTCRKGPGIIIPIWSIPETVRAHIARSDGVLLQPLYR